MVWCWFFWGFLYFRGFYAFMLWFFGGFSDFLVGWCFFDFLGVLIFGFFDAFLMIFGFFYDFFSGLLLCFYSPKWVQFLKFSCNSFFCDYNGRRWWGDTVECHGVKFTALRLVFNRICKSIKKYKTVTLWFFKVSTFTDCNLFSEVLHYFLNLTG